MQGNTTSCPICLEVLESDQCVVDCAAAHAMHYYCIAKSIQNGKKICPLDRQNLTRCIHDGDVKFLPNPPAGSNQPQVYIQFEDTPCYICHCNTRRDLQIDEVIVCSDCQSIYCHAQCEERITSKAFDYRYMWFCPPCQAARARSSSFRRINNQGRHQRNTNSNRR